MTTDIRELLKTHFRGEPEKLRQHVARVCVVALELAEAYDISGLDVEIAAWGHDLFRSRPTDFYRQQAQQYGLNRPDYDEAPIMYHGPIAAAYIREAFNYHDTRVLEAIAEHTNLSANSATNPIAQILFLADKLEPKKQKGYNDELLQLAKTDLNQATVKLIDYMLHHIKREGHFAPPPDLLAAREVLGKQ